MRLGVILIAAGVILLGGIIAGAYAVAFSVATRTTNQIEKARTEALAEQQRAGELLERKLCTTFGKLAANKPPAGDPKRNPSRAYDDNNHAILAQIGPDLDCPAGIPAKGP